MSLTRSVFLKYSFCWLLIRYSCYRQCRSRFCDLPDLRSRDGYADDTGMVEVAWIYDCRLRPVHHDSRVDTLVPNSEDSGESSHSLEPAARIDTEFDSTEAQLLRIHEQHFSSIRGRLDLPECSRCSLNCWMRWTFLELREQLLGLDLYWCFRHCW